MTRKKRSQRMRAVWERKRREMAEARARAAREQLEAEGQLPLLTLSEQSPDPLHEPGQR